MRAIVLFTLCSLLFACSIPTNISDITYLSNEFSMVGRINKVGAEDSGTCFPISCMKTDNGYNVYFLTASHVIDSGAKYTISLFDYSFAGHKEISFMPTKTFDAEVVKVGKDTDVALVRIHSDNMMPVLKLSYRSIPLGERLYSVGCPGGSAPLITEGLCSRLENEKGYAITSPIAPGNSGGPVFDKEGNVVGMSVGVMGLGNGFTSLMIFHYQLMESSCVIIDWLRKDFGVGLLLF